MKYTLAWNGEGVFIFDNEKKEIVQDVTKDFFYIVFWQFEEVEKKLFLKYIETLSESFKKFSEVLMDMKNKKEKDGDTNENRKLS